MSKDKELTQEEITAKELSYHLMHSLLNEVFYVVADNFNDYEVTLVEVKKSKQTMQIQNSWQKPDTASVNENGLRDIPFVLVFRFPVGVTREQGMYRFRHPNKGLFEEFFLTPIAVDAEGFYLEAVFT